MRKNTLLLGSLMSLMLLTQTACEDNKDEYISDYSTVLYFKNSGDVPVTLYRTGEDDNYKLVIDKAGSDLKAQTEVTATVLDNTALAIYNSENGTDYHLLPANCYEVAENTTVSFGSSDLYKVVDVTMKTEEIYKLAAPESGSYVIPFQLVNSKNTINPNKNYAFVAPRVEIPTVYFGKTGFSNTTITKNDQDEITLTLPIEMVIDNKWEFDCQVKVDESLLEAYNAENNTAFRLLPADSYTISDRVTFAPGSNVANVEININRPKLNMGTYILPLNLERCFQDYFDIDDSKKTCLFGVSYTPPRTDLKDVALTVSMLSTNAQEANEGPIAELIDGKKDTFFHSSWSSSVLDKYGHYIDIALPNEVNSVAFDYVTRHNNNNATPKTIKLWTSADNNVWELLGIVTGDLPTAAGASYSSTVYASPTKFKYFRFAVTESASGKMNDKESSSFALAEFSLYAQ